MPANGIGAVSKKDKCSVFIFKYVHLILILPVLFILNTCSDETVTSSELTNLSGVWELQTNVVSNSCGMNSDGSATDRIILIQCDDEVSVIAGSGLWGRAMIKDNQFHFTGTEVQNENTKDQSTHYSAGTLSGTSSLLEGTMVTNIIFDADSSSDTSGCVLETSILLSLVSSYQSDCLGRDEFGDPAASAYIIPWPAGKSYILNNSYCVPTGGHRQQQAYDFLIPVGDTITASRAGIVRQVKEDSPDDGQGTDHNHVMIEHQDGTVGFYAHLKQNGVLVAVGENIEAGQIIALAGHSGTPDVVHLHFGVYDNWPPVEGADQAVNFRNVTGPLDCRGGLINGALYTAQ